MAPSLSSSSQGKYDVFLSFRGEDTRRIFISHLYSALCRRRITTFIDDEEIKIGDELSPTLLGAIQESKISIIIFSKNYASSTWCLKELVKIMKCKKKKGQIVIPVFYDIEPSHVRKQTGPYEDAFAKYQNEPHNQLEIQKWRRALSEAANSAGLSSSNTRLDSTLVDKIVEDVWRKLNDIISPPLPNGLVGIQKRIDHVESLLDIEDVCVIGLWGMGGIGKTTIALELYRKLASQFDGRCFMENVRENWENYGKNKLRKELWNEISGDHKLHTSICSISSTYEESRLQRQKVLIVLDDVSELQQMEYLVGEKNRFGSGSKIIVTTRKKDVLKKVIDKLYEVEPLNDEEGLQLLSKKAFEQDHPRSEFKHLSEMVVKYAQGIPLVLKVLGSLLYSKSGGEWECTMEKLKRVPNAEILHVLRVSYEGLDYEEKNIFLYIACCLKEESKYDIISLLDGCGFSARIGIRSLEDKSLITISEGNMVCMHNSIQEMGWQIVREESMKEPEKRSRWWDPEEIYNVFKHKTDTDHNLVESIMLNMSEIKDVEISPTTFSRMRNLKLLKFYLSHDARGSNRCNVHISNGLEALPDQLRYLFWDCYPLKALPSSFCTEMLVQLNLGDSSVEKLWDGEQELANLKSLILDGSKRLIELPNLSRAKNLELIYLTDCSSLQHVSSSIFSLDSLWALDLNGCKELQCIQSDMNSKSLLSLQLGGCSKLVQFSVTSEKLEYLDLHGTAIEELPSSLGQSKNLWCLDLYECKKLKDLPNNFFHMGSDASISSTEKLAPVHDTSLSKSPDCLSLFSGLHELNLSGTCIETLPESTKLVSQLRTLNVADCVMLRSLPELPQSLQKLDANGCISLETMSSSTAIALMQNFFGSQNKRMSLREIQDSKVSLQCFDYSEWLEFGNCTRLDENALKTIMDEAIIRVKHAAYLSWMIQPFIDPYYQFHLLCNIYGLEIIKNTLCQIWLWDFRSSTMVIKFNANCCNICKRSRFAFGLYPSKEEEDNLLGLDGRHKICMQQQSYSHRQSFYKLWYKDVRVWLPGIRVPSCFRYKTTETTCRITIQLPSPSRLLGFAFCIVLSSNLELRSRFEGDTLIFVDCDFDLEDTTWHKSYVSQYMYPATQMKLISDTVFLWYDATTSYCLLEDIKAIRSNDQCTTDNPKLSFGFSTTLPRGINGTKECGVWPIYDKDLEVEKKKKLKRKRKTSPILWHCKWQALIIRRMKKSKNHRLSKHRNQVQINKSFTSRKKARISNTSKSNTKEVQEITRNHNP